MHSDNFNSLSQNSSKSFDAARLDNHITIDYVFSPEKKQY